MTQTGQLMLEDTSFLLALLMRPWGLRRPRSHQRERKLAEMRTASNESTSFVCRAQDKGCCQEFSSTGATTLSKRMPCQGCREGKHHLLSFLQGLVSERQWETEGALCM